MDPGPRFPLPIPGRGTPERPVNRFERLAIELEAESEAAGTPATRYFADPSRSILSRNQSPDVPYDVGLNPYRGCEHGCSYCYARPYHEYLGWSAGLDFETRIVVKLEAARLLQCELARRSWRPQGIALSGVTDPYQPIERRLRITRACLRVLAEHANPVSVITKSGLVARDVDLLRRLAARSAVSVFLSITTLDPELSRRMEPRAAQPRARLHALRMLASAGVPTGVSLAPLIPGLNDHEVPRILSAAREAGARFAGYAILRLPHAVEGLFSRWLEDHRPARRRAILSKLEQLRPRGARGGGGAARMRGEGPLARQLASWVSLWRRRCGLQAGPPPLSTAGFRRPLRDQLELFDTSR
ncbi:MAG: PA0069 family radical SAM protein [Myxococcota bacterium]